jgi:DNA polymerase III delta prime subunit
MSDAEDIAGILDGDMKRAAQILATAKSLQKGASQQQNASTFAVEA